jgi:hypothetical protein
MRTEVARTVMSRPTAWLSRLPEDYLFMQGTWRQRERPFGGTS